MIRCPYCNSIMRGSLVYYTNNKYFECYCGKNPDDMNRNFYGNILNNKLQDYSLWLPIQTPFGEIQSINLSATTTEHYIGGLGFSQIFKTEKIIPPAEALALLKRYVKLKVFL